MKFKKADRTKIEEETRIGPEFEEKKLNVME